MDCRILPGYKIDAVRKSVRDLAAGIAKSFKVKISVDVVQAAPAAPPTPTDAPVVLALKKAVKAVTGKTARPAGIGGGTVAAYFRRAGFHAACWSKIDETAHQPNEYCVIDNMVNGSKVYAHVFLQE